MKKLIILILFTAFQNLKSEEMPNPDEYEYDEIKVYVYSPESTVHNKDPLFRPKSLEKQNSFSLNSSDSFYVNAFLRKAGISKLKACNIKEHGFPQMLIMAKAKKKIHYFFSDKSNIFSIEMDYCTSISESFFTDLSFLKLEEILP